MTDMGGLLLYLPATKSCNLLMEPILPLGAFWSWSLFQQQGHPVFYLGAITFVTSFVWLCVRQGLSV